MAKQDFYELLGVDRSVDNGTLKSAYRKLAMKYHPDRNPGDKSAEKKFKEVSEAYEILSNPEKKSAYDQYGHDAFDGSQSGGGGFSSGGFGRSQIFLKIFLVMPQEDHQDKKEDKT